MSMWVSTRVVQNLSPGEGLHGRRLELQLANQRCPSKFGNFWLPRGVDFVPPKTTDTQALPVEIISFRLRKLIRSNMLWWKFSWKTCEKTCCSTFQWVHHLWNFWETQWIDLKKVWGKSRFFGLSSFSSFRTFQVWHGLTRFFLDGGALQVCSQCELSALWCWTTTGGDSTNGTSYIHSFWCHFVKSPPKIGRAYLNWSSLVFGFVHCLSIVKSYGIVFRPCDLSGPIWGCAHRAWCTCHWNWCAVGPRGALRSKRGQASKDNVTYHYCHCWCGLFLLFS